MKRTFALLAALTLIINASWSQTNIIVKIKPEIGYSIDYAHQSLVTDNVQFQQIINQSAIQKITSLLGHKNENLLKNIELVRHIHIFQVSSIKCDEVVNNLQQSGLFEYVEKDQVASGSGVAGITPSDTYFSRQWGFVNNGTFNGTAIANADVDMDMAWTITTGSSSTIICTLDTGLKLDHPEFSGRLWVNAGEIPNNSLDDDNNGYVDDINGWDWVNTDKDPSDDYGHGTNVTGILGASGNNSLGYAGVNWNCKLMTGKVLNASNSGSYSWMISGIIYAVQNGANIINMSIGGSGFSQGLKDACDFAYANNVALFACMMNFNNNVTYYPAGFASTIAVGSTDPNDFRTAPFFWSATSGSNYGSHIDLVAPGNYIYGLSYNSNTNYGSYWGGTSQATPLVAGVASLIHALKPNATVEDYRTILRTTAKDSVGRITEDVPGWDQYMGAGRMNAYLALQKTLSLLPVKMSRLSAVPDNEKVVLQWKTFMETNNSHFVVESSTDMADWKPKGKVWSKGDGLANLNYYFTDINPVKGNNFYRLQQRDKDGKSTFSNIAKVWIGTTKCTVKVISPFTDNLRVFLNGGENNYVFIQVFNDAGVKLREQQILLQNGQKVTDIYTADFKTGNYHVCVVSENGLRQTVKVVKQ